MENPITPTNPNPIADTFEIVKNSSLSGLFNKYQTLKFCFMKDFMSNMNI